MSDGTYLCFAEKVFPDGRQAEVWPLTFGRARLVIGRQLWIGPDDGW